MAHDNSCHGNQSAQKDGLAMPFREQLVNGVYLNDDSPLGQGSITRTHSSPLESDYEVPNPIIDLAISSGTILNQAVKNLGSAIDESPTASELIHRSEEFLGETSKKVSSSLDRTANVADELRLQATEEIVKGSEKLTNTAREVFKIALESAINTTQNAAENFSEEHPDLVAKLKSTQSQFTSFVGQAARNIFSSVYQRAERLGDSIVDLFEDSPSELHRHVGLSEIKTSDTLFEASALSEANAVDSVEMSNFNDTEQSNSTIAGNDHRIGFPIDQIQSNLLEGTSSAGFISWKNGLPIENGGVINNAYYAQKKFGNVFSEGGKFSGWTVNQLQEGIAKEYIKLSDIPVEYVTKDGKTYILNTRSASTLGGSGIPRDLWHVKNMTGNLEAESRLVGQLERNSIKSSPPKYPLPSTNIKVPQQPISPSALKALEITGGTTKFLQGIGKVAAPVAIAFDGYRLIDSYQQDGGTFGHNFQTTTGSVAGGWTGGLVGAQLGAQGGAALGGAIGVWFGGVGAVPGAAIGGVVGGVGGGIAGAFAGSEVGEWIGSGEATTWSTTTFDNVNKAVSDAFQNTTETVSDIANQAGQDVSNAINGTTEKVSEVTQQVSQEVSNVINGTTEKVSETVNQVSQDVSSVIHDTTQKASEVSQEVSNAVSDATEKVSETANQVSQDVSNIIHDTTQKASEVTQQVRQEVSNAFSDVTEKISETVNQASQDVSNVIHDTAEKASEAGQGISNAIQDTIKEVSETVNQVSQKVSETYEKTTQWLGGLFGGNR
jgi:methyl-accepting chemotaxis protein